MTSFGEILETGGNKFLDDIFMTRKNDLR